MITGTFNADGSTSFNAGGDVAAGGQRIIMDHGVADATLGDQHSGTYNLGSADPVVSWDIEFHITAPVFTYASTTDLNHGQYVKSQGGGSVAAKACAGMPLTSKKGQQ